ncbi:type IX secretion system membrane protein PorP/SprF [Gangjinia marincola]
MKNRILITLFFGLSFNGISIAQQDAQYTQYMYNTISFNPAYTGTRESLSGLFLYRNQWWGLDGAPDTFTLSVHSPVDFRKKIGLGLSVVRDEIGPTAETYIDATFSYNINTSDLSKLAFGLKVGGHILDVNFNELNTFDPIAEDLSGAIDNKFSPNFGVGLFHYSDRHYVGFSVPNILETEHFDESLSIDNQDQNFIAKERMTYYLTGGYVFDVGAYTKFKPALLLKGIDGAPLQADVSANFLFNDRLTLGAAYRWSAAVSALVGFQFNEQWMIGFAYDRETTELGQTQFNDGSMEVFLRFDLFKAYDRIISPRFF